MDYKNLPIWTGKEEFISYQKSLYLQSKSEERTFGCLGIWSVDITWHPKSEN